MQLGNHPVNVLVANYAGNMMTSGTIRNYADITNDGQMALIDHENQVISPEDITAYTAPVRFVVRNGNELFYSDYIIGSKISSSGSADYTADTQQLTYVGYNGSSGSLDVFDQNTYMINLEIMDEDVATVPYPYMKHGVYASSSNATQEEVAFGLVHSLVANFQREAQIKIAFNTICNNAGAAISADAGDTVVGNKGSKVLVISDVTDNDNIAVLAAGDYVRLGTGVTDPVYKIVSGSTTAAAGGTLVLDRPLTADVSLAGNAAEYITSALGLAANWGIKMQGVARTNFVPGVQKHFLTTFHVGLSGFESTVATYSTAASYGVGTYQEVAEMEYITQGNTGKKPYIGVPPFVSKSVASATTTYDKVSITFYEDGYTSNMSNNPKKYKTLVIYSSSADASPNDELETILSL